MLFRFHRGGFAESMATVVEVSSKCELIDVINKTNTSMVVSDVTFSHYGVDDRCGWDTFYVCNQDGHCIGMSNGAFE